jgi:hypothetical protein
VEFKHLLRVHGFGKLVARVGIVVWVDELAQPVKAVELVVDIEDGGIGVVAETEVFVLEVELVWTWSMDEMRRTSSLVAVAGSLPIARIWSAVTA